MLYGDKDVNHGVVGRNDKYIHIYTIHMPYIYIYMRWTDKIIFGNS